MKPDPAVLGLTTGDIGTCQVCSHPYRVLSTSPYRLARVKVEDRGAPQDLPVIRGDFAGKVRSDTGNARSRERVSGRYRSRNGGGMGPSKKAPAKKAHAKKAHARAMPSRRPPALWMPTKTPGKATAANRVQDVMLSATHPRAIRPGDSFLVEIFLHLRGAGPRASARTAVSAERAVVRLRAGARLQIAIRPPPGITAGDPARSVVWRPPRSSVSFPLHASERIKSGTHILTVAVSTAGRRGVELARFDIALEIDRRAATTAPAVSTVLRRMPTSYFASYARRDRAKVMGRLSTIEAIGGDVFVDCLDLREGERWEDQIRRQVQERDGFLLFWSRAARDSKWVGREWRHRLRHRGLDSITPNALESPRSCPPPRALARLQFGSRFLEATRRK
ncbi:MAG TPA: toll/interleukin-1 receptor domain-containing protein [Kofleriaceae bacterium]